MHSPHFGIQRLFYYISHSYLDVPRLSSIGNRIFMPRNRLEKTNNYFTMRFSKFKKEIEKLYNKLTLK